jgi:DNA-binding NarL/FixJ family response regulator
MMLTVFEDHDRIFQSLKAGATGYLLKKSPGTNLMQSIRDLHAGGSLMSNQIARRVVEEFPKKPSRQSKAPRSLRSARKRCWPSSPRDFSIRSL